MKAEQQKSYRISDIAARTGFSPDTLRYYEKIGLLKGVNRTPSGLRCYSERDLSRLRFIQRAKTMDFSLEEIARLIEMREDPQHARYEVRALAHQKLASIEQHMATLKLLKDELTLLINLCRGSDNGCPIIDRLDRQDTDS